MEAARTRSVNGMMNLNHLLNGTLPYSEKAISAPVRSERSVPAMRRLNGSRRTFPAQRMT